MTNFKFFLTACTLVLFTFSTFAQLKINASGEIKIGNEWTNNDYNNEVSIEVFGLNTTSYRPGSKISFGDYGGSINYGANVFIGELDNYDSDMLQLNGKNGIYFTTGGQGSYHVARMLSNGKMELRGILTQNVSISSDSRLKKNIKPLLSSLTLLKKIKGYSYDMKTEREEEYLANLQKVETKDEKSAKDLEKSKKEILESINQSTNQVGFMAQEVQLIFPQLVKTNSDGYLSVNYTGIVPILVEAIKEQQVIIDDQKTEIESMKKEIAAIKKKLGM